MSTQPKPAQLPLPGGSPGATVRVHPLRCGEVLLPPGALDRPLRRGSTQQRAMLGTKRSNWIWVPVPVFLVEHPTAGTILVDTGFHASVQDKARSSLGRRQSWVLPAREAPGESAPEQLRARGIEPAEIATIVMTHLHNDHASGAIQFPDATFVVDERRVGRGLQGRLRRGLPPRALRPAVRLADRRLRRSARRTRRSSARSTSSATARCACSRRPATRKGHQSLLLQARSDRELLLTADAAYTRRAIEDDVLPIFIFGGEDNYRRSLAAIRELHRAATPARSSSAATTPSAGRSSKPVYA